MSMHIRADDIAISARFGVTRGTGPDLSAYPLLVYAPLQHGEGVRTNDNATPVAAIATTAATFADVDDFVLSLLANQFGTTIDHVRQALIYAVALAAQG